MIRRFVKKYNSFNCLADRCLDTCCSGWQIIIDDDSYEKYKKEDSDFFAGAIAESDEDVFFNQRENGDCFFLKDNGLCHLICEKGEDYLCNTCDMYPRHIEEFPGVREYSLSVSCPLVAKELLELSADDCLFYEESDSETDSDDFDDADKALYDMLLFCRQEAVDYIIHAKADIFHKKMILHRYLKDIQEAWDKGETDNKKLSDILCNLDSASYMDKSIYVDKENPSKLLEMVLQLEPLKVEFRDMVNDAYDWINAISAEEYQHAFEIFKSDYANWSDYYTNIVLYFINSYMCGAVYDEYIYSMSMLGFYCADIILILWIYQYEKIKTSFDCSNILYQFSRELENSNDNMILFEQLIEEVSTGTLLIDNF